MPATIESVVINGEAEKRVVLQQASIMRRFQFGSSWNRLRVFIRWSIDPYSYGSYLNQSYTFHIGLMSDPTSDHYKGVLGPEPCHFLGTVNSGEMGWKNSSPDWPRMSITPYFRKYEGTKSNLIPLDSMDATGISADPANRRTVWGLDFIRGSGTISVEGVVKQTSPLTVPKDIPLSVLLNAVNQATPINVRDTLNAYDFSASYNTIGTVGPWTINEAEYGEFDTFVISWPYYIMKLYISDIVFRKIS